MRKRALLGAWLHPTRSWPVATWGVEGVESSKDPCKKSFPPLMRVELCPAGFVWWRYLSDLNFRMVQVTGPQYGALGGKATCATVTSSIRRQACTAQQAALAAAVWGPVTDGVSGVGRNAGGSVPCHQPSMLVLCLRAPSLPLT
jgi:hypothetical protein